MDEISLKRKKELLSILPIYAKQKGRWAKIPFGQSLQIQLNSTSKVQLGISLCPKHVYHHSSKNVYVGFNILQFQAIILLFVIAGCLISLPYFIITSYWSAFLFTLLIFFITLRFIYNTIELSPDQIPK